MAFRVHRALVGGCVRSGPPPTTVAALLDSGDTWGGCMDAYAGMATPSPPADTNPPTQVYTRDAGTLTLTAFSASAVATESDVFGTYANVRRNGVDAVTGEPLSPPRTAMFEWGAAAVTSAD